MEYQIDNDAACPPGYKQTEVGVIPVDWSCGRVGQYLKLQRGVDIVQADTAGGEFPVVSSSGVSYYHSKWLVKPPGVVTGRKGKIGDAYFLEEPFWPHDTTLWVKDFKSNSPKFVYYFLKSLALERLDAASAVPTLNRNNVHALYTAFPPTLAEQEAIAKALSDTDALIESLEQLIAKKHQIKQGAMQELLTGKRRLPGFSGGWEARDLRSLAQTPVTDGPHMTPRFLDDGIPFLSVNNLVNGKIDWSDLRYISVGDHEVFSRKCKPRRNDLLLGKAASVGRVAIVDTDLEFNIWSPIALVRVNHECVPLFVYYMLQSRGVAKQIDLLTNSSSQGNIGMGDIERLIIYLPELGEQAALAEVLSEMDSEISALEDKLAKTRQLKRGMMHELLTGRIRLV